MARRKKTDPIQCEHFRWTVRPRPENGVLYADGRGNRPRLGKHSLSTRDLNEARTNLVQLDLRMAIHHGLADPRPIGRDKDLAIDKGWDRYFEQGSVPQELGGWAPATKTRYRTARKAHQAFCASKSIESWGLFNRRVADDFSKWRHEHAAPRTVKTDMDAIRAVNRWLIHEGLLDNSFQLNVKIPKMNFSDTYCFTVEEVQAMVNHARNTPGLWWLADIIVTLATSGLRIGELLQLRCGDVDLPGQLIHVRDERFAKRDGRGQARRTKGRASRFVPICKVLKPVLGSITRRNGGQLFRGPDGQPPTYQRVLTSLKKSVIEPLSEKFPNAGDSRGFADGRVHSLRHHFVTQCFLRRVSEAEIIEMIGQSGSDIVARYRHLRPADSQRAIEKVSFLGAPTRPDGPVDAALHFHVEGGAHDGEHDDNEAA